MTVIFAEKIATKITKIANWYATILPLKLLLFLSAFLSKIDSQSTNHKPVFLLN